MSTRVRVGPISAIDPIAVTAVRLEPASTGTRREALVLRNERGELRAYRNVCKHLPILLNAGGGQYLCPRGEHLFCVTHGARYERDKGLCVFGPCKGESLDAMKLELENGVVFVVDEGD